MAASNALRVEFGGSRSGEARRSDDEIVRTHIPQIRFIARSVASRYSSEVDLDDLISAGYIGLLDALEKFDHSKGIQFKTYAEFRIRGAILDRLRSLDPVPKWLRQKGRQIEQAGARLQQRLGRSPDQAEIATELGMEFEEFQNVLCRLQARNVPVLDEGDDRDDCRLESLLPAQGPTPYETLYRDEVRLLLGQQVAQLPEREQAVLSLRYCEELSMKEIGQILKVHQSRVSQLHNKAVRTLRALMSPELLRGLSMTA